MEKKIENYLHLYLGCEVIADIYQGNIKALLNGVSFTHDSVDVRIRTLNCLEYLPASKIKLILRPLSDISEKEEDYVNQINCNKLYGMTEITVYLLSCSFDLFDLIENNLAIDKTQIK